MLKLKDFLKVLDGRVNVTIWKNEKEMMCSNIACVMENKKDVKDFIVKDFTIHPLMNSVDILVENEVR